MTEAGVTADTEPGATGAVAVNPFGRSVLVVGFIVFGVLMALSGRYGFHRDELYFLDSARHLSGSYVDQGVVGPLFARITLDLFGVSLPGLRLWPALCAFATVVTGGLTARELGGAKRAQLLAAAGTGCMPLVLGADHIANSTCYMILASAALLWVVARISRTGDTRWWLAGGAIAGAGTDDNHLVAAIAIAVALCALVTGKTGRALILNRWFAAGVLITVIIGIPDIWWQATHGWATFAMTGALNHENGGLKHVPAWIVGQLGIATIATVWVWISGLRFLWKSGPPLWRAIAGAYGLLFLVYMITTGAQIYYLGGFYIALLAAGFVSVDEWLHAKRDRLRRLLIASAVTTAAGAVIVLPILPQADTGWTYSQSANSGEQIGWPQLVQSVNGVWRSLPPAQRASAVIFTANYSEAGAVNELGRPDGLPTAVSGQNTDWWWGSGNPQASTVVVVASDGKSSVEAPLRRYFASVRIAATLSNPYGIRNIEWHGHVYVCTGPREPWGQLWPKLRHYD
jgi:hypothetical protein